MKQAQAGFRKGRGTRVQAANICWIIEKSRKFQKNIYFCFIEYAKAFSQQTVETSLRDGNTRSLYLSPETPVYRSRSKRTGHGTTEWFQIGKGKAVYCHPAYLTYMQSAS